MQIARHVKTKKRQGGFTLIEVIFAVAFTALTAIALYSGLSYSFGMVQIARETERATQIILDQMERIRLMTRTQIEDDTYCPPTFTDWYYPQGEVGSQGVEYTVNITRSPVPDEVIPSSVAYRDNMLMLTVEVRWNSGRGERVREMRTLVSSTGMQRYVYNN